MKHLVRVAMLLLVLASTSVPAEGPIGCMDLVLSVDPPEACAGEPVEVTATVTNCGRTTDVAHLQLIASWPGGGGELSKVMRLRAWQTSSLKFYFEVPAGASEGTYGVTVNLVSRKGGADSDSATFNVVPCE